MTTGLAVAVSKAMSSPENEIVRGVHGGFPQVWTLTVTNNKANPTTGTTVTDYVPASLEFLGCGGVDNTPGGIEEYPGSGLMTSVPVIGGCPTPTTVDTVQNPAGLPVGVYTRVVWTLGTLAVGQVDDDLLQGWRAAASQRLPRAARPRHGQPGEQHGCLDVGDGHRAVGHQHRGRRGHVSAGPWPDDLHNGHRPGLPAP